MSSTCERLATKYKYLWEHFIYSYKGSDSWIRQEHIRLEAGGV